VIRKRIGGKQSEISTRRHTADAAVVEYRRFEADPHGYDPLPDAPPETAPGPVPVVLSGALQDDYLRYSETHCENSEGWYNKKRYYLSWWADELRDVNLRGLEMEQHVFPALKNRSGRLLKALGDLRDVQRHQRSCGCGRPCGVSQANGRERHDYAARRNGGLANCHMADLPHSDITSRERDHAPRSSG
jgi:hypothetical protein